MKKRMVSVVAVLLLFAFLFTVPCQAVTLYGLARYARSQAGSSRDGIEYKNYLGSWKYWETRVMEEKSWVGENRPEPLMGDANIDGKVTAEDALFALHFAVNGNYQTYTVVSGVKSDLQSKYRSKLSGAYSSGKISELAASTDFWIMYCTFNSSFFADVTKDCVVNAKDALEILKYSVGRAKNFPEGDFTFYITRFSYLPWPTEYYPGFFEEHLIDMTDEEFCEKYNFSLDVSPTDK